MIPDATNMFVNVVVKVVRYSDTLRRIDSQVLRMRSCRCTNIMQTAFIFQIFRLFTLPRRHSSVRRISVSIRAMEPRGQAYNRL